MSKNRVRIKSAEMEHLGDEPEFDGVVSRVELARCYNWYNYFYTLSTSKKWITDYMRVHGYTQEEIRAYNTSNDHSVTQTRATQARMLLRGAIFDNNLDDHIRHVIAAPAAPKVVKSSAKDQINELIAAVDESLDAFYVSDYRDIQDVAEVVKNHRPSEYSKAVEYFTSLYEFVSNSDAYDDMPKRKRNKYVQQLEIILQALKVRKETEKRRIQKPFKKKVKPATKIVANIRYLAHSKEFDVSSLSPEKIVDAATKILWLYDTKYKRLIKLVTKNGEKFEITGTTIKNYDEKKSVFRVLRKPEDIIPKVMASTGKRATDNIFKKLTTKETAVPAARMSENHLILRIFK